MTQNFEPKNGIQIIEDCLSISDKKFIIFGGYLRDIFDPTNMNHTFKDIDVMLTNNGLNKFRVIIEAAGFLRSICKPINSDYSNQVFELEIQGQKISMDINTIENQSRFGQWCDFTCNNLCKIRSAKSSIGHSTGITTRCAHPSNDLTNEKWLAKCLHDISSHLLVPMCPPEWMVMHKDSKREERIHHIGMIRRAMKMIKRGWTLMRGLNGLKLKFTIYNGTEECAICQEKIDEKTGVQLVCKHPYHIDCLYHLACGEGPTAYNCPTCREHIMFSPNKQIKKIKINKNEKTSPETDKKDISP